MPSLVMLRSLRRIKREMVFLEKTVSIRTKKWITVVFGLLLPLLLDYVVVQNNLAIWIKVLVLAVEFFSPALIIIFLWDEVGRLQKSALIDPLSGLYNRRGGEDMLAIELGMIFRQTSFREKVKVSIVAIDIDSFKQINDRFGHDVGDMVIRELSRILFEVFSRAMDVRVRLGGDEFMLLLPQTTATATKQKMEEVARLLLLSPEIMKYDGLKVTLSVGVASGFASYNTTIHGHGLTRVFKHADQALYFVKENGRNAIRILRESTEDGGDLMVS